MKLPWNLAQCVIISILLSIVVSPLSLAQAEKGGASQSPLDMQQMMDLFDNMKTIDQKKLLMMGIPQK